MTTLVSASSGGSARPATGPVAGLADFIVNWKPTELPRDAASEARRAYLDLLGVTLVGSLEEPSAIMARLARHEGAAGPAVVIGQGFRSSASFAALANGTTGHALDYDASATLATTGHPTVCVGPAALAAAEEAGATGRALLEAMVVGFEICARVGRTGGGENGAFYGRGFHGTSVFGVFGATAAACRLLGLDVAQTCRAFGIAGTGPKGVRASYGTMGKPLHAGTSSQSGVLAAMLARDGFTANEEVLTARFGWSDAVTGPISDPGVITEGLGESLAISGGVNFKPYPSCGSSHPAIRAVLRILRENQLASEEIAGIEIAMSQTVVTETLIYDWPSTGLEGKFSLAFLVAAAWADRQVAIDTFTDEKVAALEQYRSRISVRGLPGRPPVIATVRTVDGRELTVSEPTGKPTFDDPSGELIRLSEEDLRMKFRANVTAVRSPERAEALLVALDGLEDASSLTELTELLL